MKTRKIINLLLSLILIIIFGLFALASSESSETTDQGSGVADTSSESETNLGDYKVEIKSCRLAKDYEGKDVVIVNYGFTNNGENAISFTAAFDEAVFQNGIGLNESYFLDSSSNYNEENQLKEIKKGSTLDVEVAYELNDLTTAIDVEVKQLFSFDDSIVKKTFEIA